MSHWRPFPAALRIALLVYGGLNAVLYSGLLPLWDGFDEPCHYGYVEWLRSTGSLPHLGQTPVPEEILRSLEYVPASYAVDRNFHQGVPFGTYFNLPWPQRNELRIRLERLPLDESPPPRQMLNYEAHQAPLAYLCLAPFDALWARVPLPSRVLLLRLLLSLISVVLVWFSALRLTSLVTLPAELSLCRNLCNLLVADVFYATICRISNDWLAIPIWILFLTAAVEFHLHHKMLAGVQLALWLAAGLLTKSYFLAAVPLAIAVLAAGCIWHRFSWWRAALLAGAALGIATPWYARNIILYKNLSGMQETSGGVPLARLVATIPRMPWPRVFLATVRSSLWTGNNSLFAFSAKTIGLMLLLLAAATILYVSHAVRSRLPVAERPLLGGVLCFIAGLTYSTVLTFWYTLGSAKTPAPWYVQFTAGARPLPAIHRDLAVQGRWRNSLRCRCCGSGLT